MVARLNHRAFAYIAAIFLWVVAMPTGVFAQSLQGWGVVLIHGKAGGVSRLYTLNRMLSAEGALVAMPTMSWTSTYRTYAQTLDEVEREVTALKARGARKIALAGHSLGANVSLGYATQRGGINAVIAMAPGHRPEAFGQAIGDSLVRAKQMVAAGRGAETATFLDRNQGDVHEISTSAAAYVSFFDPAGPAVMAKNAGRLRGAKLLWVVGSADGSARAVARGGRTVTVAAGHRDTPEIGASEVVDWLRSQ